MDTFMPEYGVHYGKSVVSTEVQQQHTTREEIGGAILPLSDTLSGIQEGWIC